MKNMLPFDIRKKIYVSFIAPHFSYCAETWHFCSKSAADKLEKVNERAVRFVFKDKNTPYKELLNALGRTTLVEHRVRKIASTVFKLINSKSPICLNELIKPRTSSYELRGKDALRLPKVNTTKYGLKSWHYLAPKIWNNISDAAKSCTTYKAFLKRLSDTDISRHC